MILRYRSQFPKVICRYSHTQSPSGSAASSTTTPTPSEIFKLAREIRSSSDHQTKQQQKWKPSGQVLDSAQLSYQPLEVPDQAPVPPLAHNLDRVLFNPGVHFVKDPRSNVYNFTPFLENIMSIRDFDFDKIATYVPSGKDSRLAHLAKEHKKRFVGSTSSMTGVLSKFHHVLSHMRPPMIRDLSKNFPGETTTFTEAQLRPVSVFLRYNSSTDTYAVDADRAENQEIILSILGHALETMLTTPEKDFKNYHKDLSRGTTTDSGASSSTYNYTQCGDFLMRSQLDCHDDRLPGNGMFDLKTRAVCAVRHDIDFVQINDGSDYQIGKLLGTAESFELEWLELIRSSMLKYSLQARIGRMDGIFVAYHNIRRMFGFQYVPLAQMDEIFHSIQRIGVRPDKQQLNSKVSKSSSNDDDGKGDQNDQNRGVDGINPRMTIHDATLTADKEFTLSINLLEKALTHIINDHNPKTSFNLVFSATDADNMTIFAKPMREKHIESIQKHCRESEATTSPQNYKPTRDKNTIWKHAEQDLDTLPPDVSVYSLRTKSIINGEPVAKSSYPTVIAGSGAAAASGAAEDHAGPDWRVEWRMFKNAATSSQGLFRRTFKNKPYVLRLLTSSPQKERLGAAEEAELRQKAMDMLTPPTKFQLKLRRLADKGAKRVKDDEAVDKVVWTPKL